MADRNAIEGTDPRRGSILRSTCHARSLYRRFFCGAAAVECALTRSALAVRGALAFYELLGDALSLNGRRSFRSDTTIYLPARSRGCDYYYFRSLSTHTHTHAHRNRSDSSSTHHVLSSVRRSRTSAGLTHHIFVSASQLTKPARARVLGV